jgi:hypothetical protein
MVVVGRLGVELVEPEVGLVVHSERAGCGGRMGEELDGKSLVVLGQSIVHLGWKIVERHLQLEAELNLELSMDGRGGLDR